MTFKPTKKAFGIATALVVIAAVALVLRFHRAQEDVQISQLSVGVYPIQGKDTRLRTEVAMQILSANFTTTDHLRSLPRIVKESFCAVENCELSNGEFDMVDSGATMSTDYRLPGISNRRLVLAALNQNSAVLLYEVGGYANFMRVTILDFSSGGYWSSNLSYGIRTMRDLRAAVAKADKGT